MTPQQKAEEIVELYKKRVSQKGHLSEAWLEASITQALQDQLTEVKRVVTDANKLNGCAPFCCGHDARAALNKLSDGIKCSVSGKSKCLWHGKGEKCHMGRFKQLCHGDCKPKSV